MDRRSWLKAAGLCFAAACLPKFEWGSEMRYGDLLAKLARGEQLSPAEAEALRFAGNKQEDMAAQVAGWSGNSGMISSGAIPFPVDVIYSKTLSVASTGFQVPLSGTDFNSLIISGSLIYSTAPSTDTMTTLQFNGDTASGSYSEMILYGQASGVSTGTAGTANAAGLDGSRPGLVLGGGRPPLSTAETMPFFLIVPDIKSQHWKSAVSIIGERNHMMVSPGSWFLGCRTGWWESTAAITSLNFTQAAADQGSTFGTLDPGTRVTVIGIR